MISENPMYCIQMVLQMTSRQISKSLTKHSGYDCSFIPTLASQVGSFILAHLFTVIDFPLDAYMLNQIEVDSLNNAFRVTSLPSAISIIVSPSLQIFVLNRKSLSEMHTWASPFIRTISYMCFTSLCPLSCRY